MAVPKGRTSKQRRNKRRASSYTLRKATFVECPQCHEMKRPHRVCMSCGYYNGEKVLAVE